MEQDPPAGPDRDREASDAAVGRTPPGAGTSAEDPPGRAPEPTRSDRPSDGTPAIGTPAIGTPAIGTPAHGTPAHGTPAHGTPANRERRNVSRTPVDQIGSLVPDRAAEDDPERWGDRRDESDARYLDDVPPHHGN